MKEILREIGMIERCFESIANIEFKDYKLGKNQYIYLVRIAENPGIILERLSDMIKVERSTASRVVKNLVENGFVVKRDEKDTGKKIKLYITNKGRLVYPMLKNDEEYSNFVALQGFDKEEMEVLLFYLRRIRANIEPDWKLIRKGQERPYEKVKWIRFKDINEDGIRIIEYQEKHIEEFREITYEWLKKYSKVEPEDIRLLTDPVDEIIKKDGHIFMAENEGETVGTITLLKQDDNIYELAKLGVKEYAQNRGIGKKLIVAALLKAYDLGAERAVLYTTRKFETALNLYESFGFKIVDDGGQNSMEDELKMELCFR